MYISQKLTIEYRYVHKSYGIPPMKIYGPTISIIITTQFNSQNILNTYMYSKLMCAFINRNLYNVQWGITKLWNNQLSLITIVHYRRLYCIALQVASVIFKTLTCMLIVCFKKLTMVLNWSVFDFAYHYYIHWANSSVLYHL